MKNKNFWMIFGVAVLAIGLLGWRSFSNWGGSSTVSADVPCINPALPIPAGLHIHPHLTILVNGESATIPATIGTGIGCERAIHMHDMSGTIHIEPNFPRDFTLGQFFDLWGKPFSKDQILDARADDGHEIVMTVDGRPSTEYGNLVLRDKQEIRIEYRTKAK